MNKERRKQLAEARELLERAAGIIETCGEEEREYYENMPESLQDSDKGSVASDAADALEEAARSVEEAMENIDNAVGGS